MKIRIADKVYDAHRLNDVQLVDILRLQRELADLGLRYSWGDIEAMSNRLAMKSPLEAAQDPETILLAALMVWAARRLAGEDVTFAEANSVAYDDIAYISDDEPTEPEEPAGKGEAGDQSNQTGPRLKSRSARAS